MPLPLFQEWMAYNQLDPIGSHRDDWRAAMIACTIANAMKGKRGRTAKLKDFMPKFGPKIAQRQSVGEMRANLQMFAAAHEARGGIVRKADASSS